MTAGNNLYLIIFSDNTFCIRFLQSVYSDFSTIVVNYPKIICFSYENYGYFNLLSIKRMTKQESMYASIN